MITPSTDNPTTQWNSVYREIRFGLDTPTAGFPFIYSSVTNVDGKAKFTSSGFNIYGTAPGKLFYVAAGIYAGVHSIVSVDTNGNILTSTDYISSTSGVDGVILVNYTYRIWYGYIDTGFNDYIDLKPIWKNDGTLIVNLAKALQGVFPSPLPPPVIGLDVNLFKHFYVQIIASQDYRDFLTAAAIDEAAYIITRTGYDYEDPENIYYALNGSYSISELVGAHIGSADNLSANEPIVFTNQCIIFSKIVNNTVVNVKYCNGTASAQGVGYWELENDFIIS